MIKHIEIKKGDSSTCDAADISDISGIQLLAEDLNIEELIVVIDMLFKQLKYDVKEVL